jgi:hypothetical protein
MLNQIGTVAGIAKRHQNIDYKDGKTACFLLVWQRF